MQKKIKRWHPDRKEWYYPTPEEIAESFPERWTVTGNLRWAFEFRGDKNARVSTLQQKWKSNCGRLEWRDVPTEMFPDD